MRFLKSSIELEFLSCKVVYVRHNYVPTIWANHGLHYLTRRKDQIISAVAIDGERWEEDGDGGYYCGKKTMAGYDFWCMAYGPYRLELENYKSFLKYIRRSPHRSVALRYTRASNARSRFQVGRGRDNCIGMSRAEYDSLVCKTFASEPVILDWYAALCAYYDAPRNREVKSRYKKACEAYDRWITENVPKSCEKACEGDDEEMDDDFLKELDRMPSR